MLITVKKSTAALFGILLWIACLLCLQPFLASGEEQTFDVLKIGTQVYSNVTVTTKSKSYIFILHATGMLNVRVSELPGDVRQRLGYDSAEPASGGSKTAASSVATFFNGLKPGDKGTSTQAQTVGHWQQAAMAAFQSSPRTAALRSLMARTKFKTSSVSMTGAAIALGIVFLLYLFVGYCSWLICKKAGGKGSALVWIPIFQIIPLLEAAGMSKWWILSILVPVLPMIAYIIWCFKIAKVLNKSAFVGFLLLLPLISAVAYIYLAFSGKASEKEPAKPRREKGSDMMVLETC